jgi:hypothetical protein
LPGIPMDDEVRGQLAYHLASVFAITWYARARAADLALPEAYFHDGADTRARLPRFIDESLYSENHRVRGAAEEVAGRIGRNLGHVLLALHRGDQVNREARADWTSADWERWSCVHRVVLAGGLTSGLLGETIRHSARNWLTEVGYGDVLRIEVSPYRGNTSLVGASRYLPPDAGLALCCDFGQTSVKRAIVSVHADAITEVTSLPAVPVAGAWHLHPDDDLVRAGRHYKAFVVEAICDGHALALDQGKSLGPEIVMCVAAYVDGGQLLGNGAYATMRQLAIDARPMLGEAITARTGRICRVHLIHDGTAAAAAYAGQPDTAMIALGTALGVGFPPATDEGLRTVAALETQPAT